MADQWLYWRYPYDGSDLHIVRGDWSVPLHDLVSVRLADGTKHPATAVPDCTVSVTTRLRGWNEPAVNGIGGVSDLECRISDGALRPLGPSGHEMVPPPTEDDGDAWAPDDAAAVRAQLCIRNVVVTITASLGIGPTAIELAPKRLRVHIHGLVNQTWLAPTPLRVPRSFAATSQGGQLTCWRAPSLMARFDTGTIAEIGHTPGIVWEVPGSLSGIGITSFGSLWANDDAAIGPQVVRATLPGEMGGATAQGPFEVVEGWDARPAEERTVVDLSGSWKSGDALDAMDVLLVGDGVTASDHAQFLEACRDLAEHAGQAIRPSIGLFDGLRIWAWAPPSPVNGVTIRPPSVFTHGYPDVPRLSNRPASATGSSSLTSDHLGGMFDVPSHATDAQLTESESDPAVPDPQSYAIARWRLLFDMTDAELGLVDGQARMRWAWEGQHLWTEPADTPLGVARGASDTFSASVDRTMGQRSGHVNADELTRILGSLLLPDGSPVGGHWTTGAGRGLSVILAVGHTGGGTNREHPPGSPSQNRRQPRQ